MAEEIVVPYAASKALPAAQVRSTLLTTSVKSLRDHGLFDRYQSLVAPAHRDAIVNAVAGVWLPIDLGLAHYGACDQLGLTPQAAYAIGQEVGTRVQGTMLGVMVKTAKQAGVTPWSLLPQCVRLYERLILGGGMQLVKLGPKEARLEAVNNPLFRFTYFRHGFRGIVAAGTVLFCEKTYVTELPKLTSDTSLGMRISWA